MARPQVVRDRVLALLVTLSALLAGASPTPAQAAPARTDADLERALTALERVDRAITELKECGFLPEAEALQNEVDRTRKKIHGMRGKPGPARAFHWEVVFRGAAEARALQFHLKKKAELEKAEPPAERLRHLAWLERYLERKRRAWTQRQLRIKARIASAEQRQQEASRNLEQARAAGSEKATRDKLERDLRLIEKYRQRLEAELESAVWITISGDAATFLRPMQKEWREAEKARERERKK